MTLATSLLELAFIAGRLKQTPRRGWIREASIPHPESVADHAFRMTLICMLVGDGLKLDTCKMIRMALLHDLAEAKTGDLLPEEKAKAAGLEEETMHELLSPLPVELLGDYEVLSREFRDGNSREARFVREIDKLEMAIQASEYAAVGFQASKLHRFLTWSSERIDDPLLREMLEILLKSWPTRDR